jgi:uncharacterized protein (TIRG00374 family)
MRRWAVLLVAQSLLGVALLAGWLAIVDLAALGQRLRSVELPLLLAVFGLGATAYAVRAARWRALLRPLVDVPYGEVARVSFASALVNFLLPLRTGEIARSLFLRQRRGISAVASLGTIAVDRAFDLAAVLLVGATAAAFLSFESETARAVLAVASLIILAFVCIVLLLGLGRGERVRQAVSSILPARLRGAILGGFDRFVAGLTAVVRSPAAAAQATVLSLVAALLDASAFWILLVSLGGTTAAARALLGYSLAVVTFLIPAAPGYIGSAEALTTLAYVGAGLPGGLSSSAALLGHAVSSVLVLALGILGFVGLGLRPRGLLRAVLREDPSRQELSGQPAE